RSGRALDDVRANWPHHCAGAEIRQFRHRRLFPQGLGPSGVTALISQETLQRDLIAKVGKSIFDRGLTAGSSGNISVRLEDGSLLLTPTNICLGELDPARLSKLDRDGQHVGGDKPTKEAFLHACMYCQRAGDNAVVHLHSTHAVAVSILRDVDPEDVLP